MEADHKPNIVSSLPIIGVLFVIAGAYYISQSQLKSSRPEAPAGLTHPVTEKDKIDARLWQDPFKAVCDHRQTKGSEEKKDPCDPPVYQLSEQIDRFIKKDTASASSTTFGGIIENIKATIKPYVLNQRLLHIMLIMVRGGNSAEDYERRLRNRYAVLTALRASGLTPEDTKHIRYFTVPWPDNDNFEKNVPRLSKVCPKRSEPQIIPYEWFEREELYPTMRTFKWADDRPKHVLVIWLRESVFSKHPLTRLAQLIDAIGRPRSNSSKSTSYDWARNMGKNKLIKIDLIGPSHSGTLRAMLKEVAVIQSSNYPPKDTNTVDVKSKLRRLGIYSPWSTASPALLVDKWPAQDTNSQNSILGMYRVIQQEFKTIGINFVRTIGTDDLLAMHLIHELHRRGVKVIPDPNGNGDHVALISEWDTFYGKAFPLTFATMMTSIDPNVPYIEPNWPEYAKKLSQKMPHNDHHFFPKNVHTYSYICGIDGILPESQFSQENQSNKKTESESKWAYAKSLELPIGKGQLDYVRRLAQKLSDEYKRSHKKLKAVGVVGSDVYDKLILLHALREELDDDVIFFTTDLDARLMHDEQLKWTRNVIVASNFGLQLNERYQRDVYQDKESSLPPFRDNYQSALFFGCRVALGLRKDPYESKIEARFRNVGNKAIQLISQLSHKDQMVQEYQLNKMLRDDTENMLESICHPRLFEIGRNGAVDLSILLNNKNINDKKIIEIHPEPYNQFPGWWTFLKHLLLILLATLICVFLLLQLSQTLQKAIITPFIVGSLALLRIITGRKRCGGTKELKAKPKQEEQKATNWVIRLSVVAVIMFVVIVIIDHYRQGGELFSLVAGISIWPGGALRLLAIILSVYLLSRAINNLRAGEEELCKWFNPQKSNKFKMSTISYKKWRNDENLSGWSKFPLNPYTWWRYRQRIGISHWKIDDEHAKAKQLWEGYLDRGTFWNRVHRLILPTLLFWILLAVLCWFFGRPNTPYRGRVSGIVDAILALFCVTLMNILMFFVVDTTRLCLRPIHAMIKHRNWPYEFVNKFRKKGAIKPRDVENWLDVRFTAQLTECMEKLIYYPFIIIAIMIAARSRFFDNWNWPISLITVYIMASIYMISCAVRLQLAAKKARRTAIRDLRTTLDKIRFSQHRRSEQIEYLIEQIESLRQGAFKPFTENPVIHVLISSGGVTLLTLLKLFSPS